MVTSQARIDANRQNALNSTGPKTDEGKAASRRNALKHGLTGSGVVLLGEDQHLVADRCEKLAAEIAPDGDMVNLMLAQKLAVLWVRSERSYRHEVATTAKRVRGAEAAFDEARRTEADHLISYIGAEPLTNARRLRAMPEGVDLLLQKLRDLRDVAAGVTGEAWSMHNRWEVDCCMGHVSGASPHSRCHILGLAMEGKFDELRFEDGAGLDRDGRIQWAREQMILLIEDEIARLEAHRETLDLAGIAQSRAEAVDRALVDTGPEATLARKYEASTERAMFRTLNELRGLRKERAQALKAAPPTLHESKQAQDRHHDAFPELAEINESLASFFPGSPPPVPPADSIPVRAGSPSNRPQSAYGDKKKRPKLPR